MDPSSLRQYVEYFIDRGVLGVTKDLQHPVLEYTGDPVAAGTRWKFDSSQSLVVPVMPPTLIDVCRLLQIYYVLKVKDNAPPSLLLLRQKLRTQQNEGSYKRPLVPIMTVPV